MLSIRSVFSQEENGVLLSGFPVHSFHSRAIFPSERPLSGCHQEGN
jgi:hypothetical protein